jgi:uncharacterized membrane protein YjjP (DUF1212 family)
MAERKQNIHTYSQGERPMSGVVGDIPDLPEDAVRNIYQAFGAEEDYIPKPRSPQSRGPSKPVLRKTQPTDVELEQLDSTQLDSENKERHLSGKNAHERASRLAAKVESYHASAAPSRSGSIDEGPSRPRVRIGETKVEGGDERRSSEDSDDGLLFPKPRARGNSVAQANDEAYRLVRSYTQRQIPSHYDVDDSPLHSGQITPVIEQRHAEDYVPRPSKYRGGVLASLIKLAGHQGHGGASPPSLSRHAHSQSVDELSLSGTTPLHSPGHSPPQSGATTPTYGKHRRFRSPWPHSRQGSESPSSLAALVGSSLNVAASSKEIGEDSVKQYKQRPAMGKRSRSSDAIHLAMKKIQHVNHKRHEEIKITKHIAQTLARHKYIVKLCKALMDYGAPTHRLEEYLKSTSRVLEIEAQFLYIPGCMLISFDDASTHTAEVKLIRRDQGIDLGKLRDTHQIYKEVVHDQIDVVDAMKRLERVMARKPKFPVWFRILMHGLAAASVGPFAFQARLIDLPIAFALGCLLGTLQLVVSQRSDLYANVFEITAAVLTSFFARAFGSIKYGNGDRIFCFSALAQSSIALILPGYAVLCASLELQSRSIVAGSVRMVYAIIYSLFLGYGITIGTVLYGWMDKNAVSATTCQAPMEDYWFFFFVPVFTMCLIIVNQAKWKQAPMMLVISMAGYLVNFFTGRRFKGNAQVTQTLGALTIGVMANLYARLGPMCENFFMRLWFEKLRPKVITRKQALQDQASNTLRKLSSAESGEIGLSSAEKEKQEQELKQHGWLERKGYGMAAAAMLPAIFVQVPSGLAVSGSLVAGITSADQIISNSTGTTTVSSGSDALATNGAAFTVSLSVVQIAIGITVGLFISAVVVYPLGKRRSGLFSF